jgi:hypothetical protein
MKALKMEPSNPLKPNQRSLNKLLFFIHLVNKNVGLHRPRPLPTNETMDIHQARTDVIIFKIFLPENLSKNSVFVSKESLIIHKFDHSIGF